MHRGMDEQRGAERSTKVRCNCGRELLMLGSTVKLVKSGGMVRTMECECGKVTTLRVAR